MTRRFSSRSFAGTKRMLVAVGTERLASMFCAIRAAAPRRGVGAEPSAAVAASAVGVATGGALAAVPSASVSASPLPLNPSKNSFQPGSTASGSSR